MAVFKSGFCCQDALFEAQIDERGLLYVAVGIYNTLEGSGGVNYVVTLSIRYGHL